MKWLVPDSLVIHNVSEVQEELLLLLSSEEEEYLLDASELGDIDAAGIQVLLSFQKSVKSKNKRVRIINVKQQMSETLTEVGAMVYFSSEEALG